MQIEIQAILFNKCLFSKQIRSFLNYRWKSKFYCLGFAVPMSLILPLITKISKGVRQYYSQTKNANFPRFGVRL